MGPRYGGSPLAYLYELGGRSVWPPAIVHFVMQAAIKLVILSGDAAAGFPLIWMAGCAAVPYLVFLVPLTNQHRDA